ncbi:MAG: superoxide dismutase [Phocaeicola sp.]|nr:superoxide dismutase [Phocaeicola sp.]
MKHEMPQLPYAPDGLTPVISADTLSYHYGKHLQAYINNLNTLTAGTEYEQQTVEEIVASAPAGAIFNNAGQVLNHTLYFLQFTPAPQRNRPEGPLAEAIDRDFGSFENLQQEMSNQAATLFGSGWAWLYAGADGKLGLGKYPNAECPLRENRTPLLCIDVWEHAYYLDYQNRRADYIKALWNIIDWETIERRYSRGMSQQ